MLYSIQSVLLEIILSAAVSSNTCATTNETKAQDLAYVLMQNYSRNALPDPSPVEVVVEITIQDISDISAITGTFVIDFWIMRYGWTRGYSLLQSTRAGRISRWTTTWSRSFGELLSIRYVFLTNGVRTHENVSLLVTY
ncbi:hypothetical protein L596_005386 [Steinernema carpocapsae]|uniref:Neurotransmitter-gated ion-channel ligand-binding domain-containing protein n=1 Tax=Steinernema carpocapsae TaxID=34508 RepID=A0A4U8V0F6_STECR|nr:hypothetical protein L596_005386 [Steinernema carpocapsae]